MLGGIFGDIGDSVYGFASAELPRNALWPLFCS